MHSLIPQPENPATSDLPVVADTSILTALQFRQLSDVPPAIEWFANIDNPQTRRAYENDLHCFMRFAGIHQPEDFRIVTRSHVLAWRKSLEAQQLGFRGGAEVSVQTGHFGREHGATRDAGHGCDQCAG